MQGKRGSRSGVLQWVVVLVVGVLVVTVVLGLNLIPRLDAGQKVLNAAKPAFATERLTGARAGIDLISKDVDMADPIVTAQGAAAGEVPKLIAFVSQKTGLSQAAVVIEGIKCCRLLSIGCDDKQTFVRGSVREVLIVPAKLLGAEGVRHSLGFEPVVEEGGHPGIGDRSARARRLVHKGDELECGLLRNCPEQSLQERQLKTLKDGHHR